MSGKEITRHYMQDIQFEMLVRDPEQPAEPCIVVQGVTDHVYLPVSKLPWFDWKVARHLAAASEQIWGPTERIKRLDAIAPQSVGTTHTGDGKVVVLIDHGYPTQQAISLEPDVAANLGGQLGRGRIRNVRARDKALGRIGSRPPTSGPPR